MCTVLKCACGTILNALNIDLNICKNSTLLKINIFFLFMSLAKFVLNVNDGYYKFNLRFFPILPLIATAYKYLINTKPVIIKYV